MKSMVWISRALVAIVSLAVVVGCHAGPGLGAGAKAPPFVVEPLALGMPKVGNADFKGKVVLIDFWATWCGPCRESMPIIQHFYDAYKDQGLAIVAVTDEDRSRVAHSALVSQFNYPFYLDPGSDTTQAFGVGAFPTTVLIGRDGIIVFRETGMDPKALEDAIKNALKS